MATSVRTDWPRSTPFTVLTWLYVPFLAYVVPFLGKRVSENVFALFCLLGGTLLFAAFYPYVKGWLSGKSLALLVVIPYSILGVVFLALMPD